MTEQSKIIELTKNMTTLQILTVTGIANGKSQREAYFEAGGKAKNEKAADAIVSRMLTDAKVKAFYDYLIESATKDSVMTLEQALERLSLIASTRVTDILDFEVADVETINNRGEIEIKQETIWKMKESAELQERAASAIKSVTMTKFGPKIEMYDATDAIGMLAKMKGWEAAKKIDLSVVDDGTNEF